MNVRSKITGLTPVLIAAGRPGPADVVRLLLAHGADLKAHSNDGVPPSIGQCPAETPRIFRLVLDGGADVNARGPRRNTALMEAVAQGDAYMAKALIQREPTRRLATPKDRQLSPLRCLIGTSSFRDY